MNIADFRAIYGILSAESTNANTYSAKILAVKQAFQPKIRNDSIGLFWLIVDSENAIRDAYVYFTSLGMSEIELYLDTLPFFYYIYMLDNENLYSYAVQTLLVKDILFVLRSPIMSQNFFNNVCDYYKYRENLLATKVLEAIGKEYNFSLHGLEKCSLEKEKLIIFNTNINELKKLEKSSPKFAHLFRQIAILKDIAQNYYLTRFSSLDEVLESYYSDENMRNFPFSFRINDAITKMQGLDKFTIYDIANLENCDRFEVIEKLVNLKAHNYSTLKFFLLCCQTLDIERKVKIFNSTTNKDLLDILYKQLSEEVSKRGNISKKELLYNSSTEGYYGIVSLALCIISDRDFLDVYKSIIAIVKEKLKYPLYPQIHEMIVQRSAKISS